MVARRGRRPPARRAERRRARRYFFRLDELRELDDRFAGTLPPARRASLSPMAMACLRLVTFLPERPDLSLPRFISCMARSTFLPALAPYLRDDFFFAAIDGSFLPRPPADARPARSSGANV